MKNYFEIKATITKNIEGKEKNINSTFIIGIDEYSFELAEQYFIDKIGSSLIQLNQIKFIEPDMLLNLDDVNDDLVYYKAQVVYLVENDETGKIKKTKKTSYVYSNDITNVKELLQTDLRNQVYDYIIHTIQKTDIVDIFVD